MNHDRHENSRWEFRAEKLVNDRPVRLYRSRQDPTLFKRVTKHGGSTPHTWEIVQYTRKDAVVSGAQVWARHVDEILAAVASAKSAEDNLRTAYGSR